MIDGLERMGPNTQAVHAGEARHLHAVRPIASTWLEPAQEHYVVTCLSYRHVEGTHSVELVGKFDEFVIVRRKQGSAPDLFVQVFRDRPGQ